MTPNIIFAATEEFKAAYEEYTNLIESLLRFKFEKHYISCIFEKQNSFFDIEEEVDLNIQFKNAFSTLVSFENVIQTGKFNNLLERNELYLIEYILCDNNMNKIYSVIVSNTNFGLRSYKALNAYGDYFKVIKEASPNINMILFDDSNQAFNFMSKLSYQYLFKRYFGLTSLKSCVIAKEENFFNYCKMMLIIADLYRISKDKKKKLELMLSNLTSYADEYAFANKLKNLIG